MKISFLLPLLAIVLLSSCKNKATSDLSASNSFLPMQIGNRWGNDAQNYTEIQDTLTINGKLYYKFYSLIGGDATDTKYLRIDEKNELLEAYPGSEIIYTHAKFNAALNDVFYTLNDKSENDYEVKLVDKTADKRTFEFDMVHHPNLKGSKHKITYIKGLGIDDNWKSIKIDGKVIK